MRRGYTAIVLAPVLSRRERSECEPEDGGLAARAAAARRTNAASIAAVRAAMLAKAFSLENCD